MERFYLAVIVVAAVVGLTLGQHDDQPAKKLKTGDTFYEPAL